MERLEVSAAVRRLYRSLGVKELKTRYELLTAEKLLVYDAV